MAAPKMTRGSFRGLVGSMENNERTRLLLIMPRSFRPEYELITEGLEINDDVFSTYLRPRSNLEEIKDAGFDSFNHSIHLIDIAMKDLGIWMKPLVSNHWNRSEIDVSPTSNCDFSTVTWTCFKHPDASDSSTILLPFDPLDFQGKCFTHLSSKEEINETLGSEPTIEDEIQNEEIENDDVVDEIIEVVGEENTESPLKVEVRQTIEMLKADGLDMTGIMEHPKFLDVSERASVAGIDVWTMVVGMFQ
ncbi:MAG: hypothetical protein CMA29_02375 [Euryarchaeota archaeon]|nr:hypothetical protein [Euryarchaeota archaeon]